MSDFINAIKHNWPEYTIIPGASKMTCCVNWRDHDDDITDNDLKLANESSFSWRECESCSSHLGGDRHPAHAILTSSFSKPNKPGDIYHISICVDCRMFHANGDEPESWKK